MLDNFESKITFEIPTNLDFETMALSNNYTLLLTGIEEMDFHNLGHRSSSGRADLNADGDYDRFIGDVWVGIVLTLMIVTSIFCMCACFLYHKFRQWKQSVSNFNAAVNDTLDNIENGRGGAYDTDSLPSYSLVSGLPSYDDALECYRKSQLAVAPPPPPPSASISITRPSLMKLFSFESNSQYPVKEIGPQQQQSDLTVAEPSFYETNRKELYTVEQMDEKKGSSKISRQILHFDFKLKSNSSNSSNSAPNSSVPERAGVGCRLVDNGLPQLHKSPSLVAIYDSDFWRNGRENSLTEEQPLAGTRTYSSNSLPRPRSMSRQLVTENLA